MTVAPKKARLKAPDLRPRVLVVTPAFNAERYIDEAVMSVITQACAGARLFYHIQDGGSRDGTLDRLAAWKERIDGGHVPYFAGELHFSFASQQDRGMYQAVNRAFRRLRPKDEDILTWINSDDQLASGAIATVVQVFRDVPECRFLSGRVSLLNSEGAMMTLDPPRPWTRETIAAGLHDGRTMPFIMQEGTFFSGHLWNAVGGVDESFRLAGDWDLWRRMAKQADHFTVDAITGYHRRRPGQLSEDMVAYYQEVDKGKQAPAQSHSKPKALNLVKFDAQQGRWLHAALEPTDGVVPTLIIEGIEAPGCSCDPEAGFGPIEGPYPEYNLPSGIRWIVEESGTIALTAPAPGKYRVRMTLRATQPMLWITIATNAREPFPLMLSNPRQAMNQIVEFSTWLSEGNNVVTLRLESQNKTSSQLLLIACEAVMLQTTPAIPLLRDLAERAPLAVIIPTTADPDRLESSLLSTLSTPSGCVSVIVSRCDHPLCRLVLNRFLNAVKVLDSEYSDLTRIDPAILDAARAGGALYLMHLAAGDMLLPDAVKTALQMAVAIGADEVAGLAARRSPRGNLLWLETPGTGRTGILKRLTACEAEQAGRVEIAQATVTRITASRPYESGPIVWLVDDCTSGTAGPMFMLAAALSLMGVDARHVRINAAAVSFPFIGVGEEALYAETVSPVGNAVTLSELSEAFLLSNLSTGTCLTLPRAIDTVRLRPRDKAIARDRLGLPQDALVVVIARETAEYTRDLLERIARAHRKGVVHVLNFGARAAEWRGRIELTELTWEMDPVLLSFYVSACDLALIPDGKADRLALIAWACGIAVMDGTHSLYLDGRKEQTGTGLKATLDACARPGRSYFDQSSRELVKARHSVEALALAFRAARPMLSQLPQLQGWLNRRTALQAGEVRVHSIPAEGLSTERFRGQSDGTLTPLEGCYADTVAQHLVTIRSSSASALLVLGHVQGTALHLVIRGEGVWAFSLNGGELFQAEAGPKPILVTLTAPVRPGLHRLDMALLSPSSPDPATLFVDDWQVSGVRPLEVTESFHAYTSRQATGRELSTLVHDGDWRRVSGFGELEPAYPPAGFHAPLRWSIGTRCTIVVRARHGGARLLRLVVSGIVPGQCIRPIIAEKRYAWSAPLEGTPGRVAYQSWIVEMTEGDTEITLELSSAQPSADGRDLGIVLLGVELALGLPDNIANIRRAQPREAPESTPLPKILS